MYKKMAETIDHLFLCCYIALDIQVLFSIRDLLGIAKIDAKFIKGSQVVVKHTNNMGAKCFQKERNMGRFSEMENTICKLMFALSLLFFSCSRVIRAYSYVNKIKDLLITKWLHMHKLHLHRFTK